MSNNCVCQNCQRPLDCGDTLCAVCETYNGDSCYFREVKPDEEIEDICNEVKTTVL
mgnify:CR=1 FL=1